MRHVWDGHGKKILSSNVVKNRPNGSLQRNGLFRSTRWLPFPFPFPFSLSLLLLLAAPTLQHACAQETAPPVQDNMKPNNAKQRKADKKKEARKAEGESIVQKGLDRHMAIQSKAVQKRMKRSKKESERINKNKKKPFYQRWFRKSQKSRKWYQFWKKRGKK